MFFDVPTWFRNAGLHSGLKRAKTKDQNVGESAWPETKATCLGLAVVRKQA